MNPNSRWLVAYTKPRNEKKALERLSQKGFTVYCPLKKEKKKWSDRWKWVESPLLPSYVFVWVDPSEQTEVLQDPSVVRWLYWLGKPAVVRDEEIETLRKWLNDFPEADFQVEPLRAGDRVRVESGALMGKEAQIEEIRGQWAWLALETLDLKIRVDLSLTSVVPAAPHGAS
jgi:transcription antitermination factor NusG